MMFPMYHSTALLVLLLVASITSAQALIYGEDSTAFIKSSCNSTLYPALCFASLARFAGSVRSDPVRLAWLAANLTAARVRVLSAHVNILLRHSPAADNAPALRDCAEVLGDAVDLARSAAAEIGLLAAPEDFEEMAAVEGSVAWRVSNAQTWMSAAMTDEDTCTDGFEGVGDGPLKADVCRRVRLAREYTSNALALVNRLLG